MHWILPLIFLIILEACADIISKLWEQKSLWWLAVLAIAAYALANVFWLFAIKYGSGLARGGVLFSIGSAILAIAIGVFLFHEPVNRYQVVGLVLGIIAIAFLAVE